MTRSGFTPGTACAGAPARFFTSSSPHLNLLVVWRKDCAEPWLLACSLEDPGEILRLYRLRMRIEAFFKDGKAHFYLERLDSLLSELLLDHLSDTLSPPQEVHQSG